MSWPLVKLDNHVDILSGFAFKSESFNDRGEGLPLVRIRDVVPGVSYTYYSGDYTREFLLSDGDLLIGMDGDFNRARWKGGQAILNQRVCKITAKANSLDQGYLYHFLPKALEKIHAETPAVTVKHLSVKGIRAIEIPFPPLPEQKRIAAILDKADAIRRKRQQSIQLADDFLRAVFLDMSGDPVTNPKEWEIRPISELCSYIVDCVNRTAPTVDYSTPYKMIRTTNVRNYTLDIDSVRYVEEETYKNWIRRLKPEIGDIIFTREAPAGEAAVIRTDDKLFLGQRTMHFRPVQEIISSEYLLFELMGGGVKSQINKMHAGSTVTHLSVPECKKFKIRVPPLELQKKFESLRKAILRVRALGADASDTSLFESVSQKAFSGQL